MEKTIQLTEPVKLGEIEYKEVTLRQPRAGELEEASKESTQIGQAIKLISIVGKIPRKAVAMFVDADLEECSDFLGSFAEARRKARAEAAKKEAEAAEGQPKH